MPLSLFAAEPRAFHAEWKHILRAARPSERSCNELYLSKFHVKLRHETGSTLPVQLGYLLRLKAYLLFFNLRSPPQTHHFMSQ